MIRDQSKAQESGRPETCARSTLPTEGQPRVDHILCVGCQATSPRAEEPTEISTFRNPALEVPESARMK